MEEQGASEDSDPDQRDSEPGSKASARNNDDNVIPENVPETVWVPDFNLGEDVRDERRLEQDRLWSKAIADGRVHLSHREFALQYAPRFQAAIEDFEIVTALVEGMYSTKKSCPLRLLNETVMNFIVQWALPGQAPLVRAICFRREVEKLFASPAFEEYYRSMPNFRVCLRKRPLLEPERKAGAYDVTQCVSKHSLILHEGKLARNGRLLSMTHHQFAFDHIFDERYTNDDLCKEAVEPLLTQALEGNHTTLLCFGQTGTGDSPS